MTFAAVVLIALFAYSIYSILASEGVASTPGIFPPPSGWPALINPLYIFSNLYENLLFRFLLNILKFFFYILFFISIPAAYLAQLLAELLAPLLGQLGLRPPHTISPPPAASTPTAIGITGGGALPASTASAVEGAPLFYLLLFAAVASAIFLIVWRPRRAAEVVRGESSAAASPPGLPQSADASALPTFRPPLLKPIHLPQPRSALLKLPLEPDVPPVWPLGEPLTVEPAVAGVSLKIEGCALEARGAGPWTLAPRTPCLAVLRADAGDLSETLSLKFADLHKEIANTFYVNFERFPPHMTAREILSVLGISSRSLLDIFEKAAYSMQPLSYGDYVEFYRALRSALGHVATPE